MDSNHWTGDDTREFNVNPDDEYCRYCGAAPDQDCDAECECLHCERRRERQSDSDGPRGGEAAAEVRQLMTDAQELKR